MAGFVKLLTDASRIQVASQATQVITTGASVAAGNHVMILSQRSTTGCTITGVTSTGSGTVGSVVESSALDFITTYSVCICSIYCPNGLSNTDTIAVAWSGGAAFDFWTAILAEYTGLATASWADKIAQQTTFGTSADSGSTATLSQADELVFGGFMANSGKTIAAGSGYNLHASQLDDAGPGITLAIEDKVVAVTTAVNATFAWDATGISYAAFVSTYKVAAVAATSYAIPTTRVPSVMIT